MTRDARITIPLALFFAALTTLPLTSCTVIRRFLPAKEVGASPESVEELRLRYLRGDLRALEEIIAIYRDENQPLEVRLVSVRMMGESRHPLALQALTLHVEEAKALNLDLMTQSVKVLGEFQDDPEAADALLKSIFAIDEKLRGLEEGIFASLAAINPKDQVLALLDIYERSRASFYNTALMVSRTLGRMNTDEVIPILVFIANDATLDVKTRNRAIEILAKKTDRAEVVKSFVEMLTDPSVEAQVRDFALRAMQDVKQEEVILAILGTYTEGKKSYYSLLNTLLDALGNFDDPMAKPALVEIALSDDLPQMIRTKAIKGLANFRDPEVFERLVPLLEDPENYRYYGALIALAGELGVTSKYADRIAAAALIAQEKAFEAKTEKPEEPPAEK